MTRIELIRELIKRSDHLTFPLVQEGVDVFFREIIQALCDGKKVTLRGFGIFNTKERSARKFRYPRTGQKVNVESRHIASFKASPIFLTHLNKGEKQ